MRDGVEARLSGPRPALADACDQHVARASRRFTKRLLRGIAPARLTDPLGPNLARYAHPRATRPDRGRPRLFRGQCLYSRFRRWSGGTPTAWRVDSRSASRTGRTHRAAQTVKGLSPPIKH